MRCCAEAEATTRRREADADVAESQRACAQFESARAAALKEIEEIANALADLIAAAETIAGIRARTGRDEPTVIT